MNFLSDILGVKTNSSFIMINADLNESLPFVPNAAQESNNEKLSGSGTLSIIVSGNSMAPEYPSGSQAFIKKIDGNIFIEWGRDYVLDTSNGIVLKRIVAPEKEGYLRCLSINPDQKTYAPFDISMSEVYGIYRIVFCMSLK
jgi:phage repressor protein C with HTH and peptisase S24 domain